MLCHFIIVSLCCKPPLRLCIAMVSAAYWLTPTLAFSAQRRTCWASILIVLASTMTDFSDQKASHYIFGTQWWLIIEWWWSNVLYSKQALGVLSISSTVLRCGIRGEEDVTKVLEIVSTVWGQGYYECKLGVVILIRWHHFGWYSLWKRFA